MCHTHRGPASSSCNPSDKLQDLLLLLYSSPSSSSNWIWIKMAFPFLLCFCFVWLKTDLPREITVSGEKSHLRKNVFTNPKQQSPSPSISPSLLSPFLSFSSYICSLLLGAEWEKSKIETIILLVMLGQIHWVSSRSLSLSVCFWTTTGLTGVVSGISAEANISAKCRMDWECQKARLNESLAAALWQLSVLRN